MHWQNLNDDGRHWLHGRGWMGRVRLEWVCPPTVASWGVTLGDGDCGRDVLLYGTVPFLGTVYLGVSDVFRPYCFGSDIDRGSDRDISVSISEWTIRWSFWVGTMASWSRRYPWCRWWRQGHVELANVLGRRRHSVEVLAEHIPVRIDMPEGSYVGEARFERRTWKRALWFRETQESTWIDVPKGIPFAGKGENSWDCGDDGLYGCGIDGLSVERACEHFAAQVLRNRKRYGMPSDAAIVEALGTAT